MNRWDKPSRYMVISLLAAALLPCSAFASEEEDEWVEVTGEAAIVDDNEVHAREMAQQQALRQAVEMVAGTIVSGISESSSFISVRDDITSQSSGYVRRYEVTGSECEEGICRVSVRALVSKSGLAEKLSDLGLLIAQQGYPRLIMLLMEKNVGEERALGWWSTAEVRPQVFENTLGEYLNKILREDEECRRTFDPEDCWTPLERGRRFRLMDYRVVDATPHVEEAEAGVDLTDDQARALALLTDAEVALVGRATVHNRGDLRALGGSAGPVAGPGYYALFGDASVKVMDVESGETIGHATVTADWRDLSPERGGELLLQRMAREMAVEVQQLVAEKWRADQTGSRWV
ncbi:MAG: flagellar assembly protein T N-terminal domain-containing protein, partial [Myxococcota bacterium]